MDPSVLDEDRPGAFALAFQTTRDLPYIYSVWPRGESDFYQQRRESFQIISNESDGRTRAHSESFRETEWECRRFRTKCFWSARRLRIAFLIKYERLFRTVQLNETNPMGSTHLRCSSAGLRCLAVLFILAIHDSTSVW